MTNGARTQVLLAMHQERQDQLKAFFMGTHASLGKFSIVQTLPIDILGMIADEVLFDPNA